FNASNGNDIWNLSVSGDIVSSPAVACDTVYFGTNIGGKVVYALNATDGSVRWTYDTGNCIMSSPSVSDGIMFIGSDTGYLYAFGTPDKFWKGNVVLLEGETLNVTAENSGTNYTINRTTALGALARAAGYGGFNFTINDSCLAFVDSVAGVSNNETEGTCWRYWVNYPDDPEPAVGANEFELNASSTARDVITFYYGGEETTPENSSVAIQITAQTIEKKPEAIFITVERVPFIAAAASQSNLNVTMCYPGELPDSLDLTDYDLIFLEHISNAEELDAHHLSDVDANKTTIISLAEAVPGNIDLTEHPWIAQYWSNCDPENIVRLMTYLEVNFCGLIGDVRDPLPIPDAFIQHPDAPNLFSDTRSYLDWYAGANRTGYRYNTSNLTIGIANWHDAATSQDIQKLIRTLEQKGANVISIGFTGTDDLKRFYRINNSTIVDCIICTKSFRINFENGTKGVEDLKLLNVPVMKAVRLYNNETSFWQPDDWRNETSHGISILDLGFQVGILELDAVIDPIVISGRYSPDKTVEEYVPIDEQINWICDRAISWAHLSHIPNSTRKVAVIYYNHGGGKDNIGACYVNVPPSLRNIVSAMNESGYNITGEIPGEKVLIDLMMHEGTNVGTWAPGELEKMVSAGNATLLPVETYLKWFHELEEPRQDEVIKRWGEPPGEIMVWTNNTTGKQYFVIPKLSFGNVILTPQPTRGWLQNNTVLYHNKDVPPHHQYIAFYLWLKHEFKADAIIHFGKHGTQEWLPGKETGLSAKDCWPAILIQDIPVIYPYIVDNIAEGTQAKRRGSATMITHLTPPIVASGLYGNYTNLAQAINDYYLAAGDNVSQEGYKDDIIATYLELHLNETYLNDTMNVTELNATAADDPAFKEFVSELADYLYDLKNTFMPYGLHTFGEPPEGEPLISLIESMLRKGYKKAVADRIGYSDYPNPVRKDKNDELDNYTARLLEYVVLNHTTVAEAENLTFNASRYPPDESATANVTSYLNRSKDFAARIAGCTIEINRTLEGVNGSYIPPSSADDPVRDPDSLPTGRNFHSLNPDRIPTESAYKIGTKMADALLDQYRADHDNSYPRKLTIVLWAWCTTDGGVVESEILNLVGAEPVRDEYNKVIDVKLMPVSELCRPRIDVMVVPSGLERDFSPKSLKLIDRAIRLAATANDSSAAYPNYVKENSEEIYLWLLNNTNLTGEEARYFSMSRIFLEAPGTYGPNLDSAIGASGTWNNSSKIGNLFASRMNYIYGDSVWGVPERDIFEQNLAQTDAIVHNQNSNLYGFIDNDDVFQYVGGLALAYKAATGEDFDSGNIYVTDNSDPDSDPTVSTLRNVLQREMRTRYLNPKWIEGMMGEGYAGAREMDRFVEYLWGWEATVPDVITDSMWNQVYDVYVNGAYSREYNLDVDGFVDTNNPYAYQSLTGRMLETIRKGYWTPSSIEVQNALVSEYVESIVKNGVTCCHHTCANPFLDKFVEGIISVPGVVSKEDAARYRELMDTATGKLSTSSQSTNTGSSRGGGGGDGTYPPDWNKKVKPTVQPAKSSSHSNDTTITEGGVGIDASQSVESSKESQPSKPSDYVEGHEMTVEKSEKSSN
ncbi:MAG: cobaltochelatase subunit CobN, partial [Methanosarcinales archaeon]|nr:cobaltochelatase subunit CobN [Methanosarcinales archaeon]